MDELEISGKRYISSRRAAKEHHYHPDYIGQLIRAHKIPGQKVGRSWYVEAEALQRYLYAKEESPTPFVSSSTSPSITPTPSLLQTMSLEERRIPITVQTHMAIKPTSRLTYVADDAPLLPNITRNTEKISLVAPNIPPATQPAVLIQHEKIRKGFSPLFTIFVAILCTFGYTLGFSALVSVETVDTYQNSNSGQITFNSSYLASFTQIVKSK